MNKIHVGERGGGGERGEEEEESINLSETDIKEREKIQL